MRAQGAGYLNTIFYWNKDLPLLMRDPDVPDHDAGRDRREVHEAVRARDPSLREHDGGTHRRARAHRPDLHVRELRVAGAPFSMAVGDHDARAVRRVPAGVHLHAARRACSSARSARRTIDARRTRGSRRLGIVQLSLAPRRYARWLYDCIPCAVARHALHRCGMYPVERPGMPVETRVSVTGGAYTARSAMRSSRHFHGSEILS